MSREDELILETIRERHSTIAAFAEFLHKLQGDETTSLEDIFYILIALEKHQVDPAVSDMFKKIFLMTKLTYAEDITDGVQDVRRKAKKMMAEEEALRQINKSKQEEYSLLLSVKESDGRRLRNKVINLIYELRDESRKDLSESELEILNKLNNNFKLAAYRKGWFRPHWGIRSHTRAHEIVREFHNCEDADAEVFLNTGSKARAYIKRMIEKINYTVS